MGVKAVFLALTAIGTISCVTADNTKAWFKPEDPVRKIGDDIDFQCRSPAGYTSLLSLFDFAVEHNGVQIIDKNSPDMSLTTTDDDTLIKFDIAELSRQNAGNYTCSFTESGNGESVSVTTHLFIIEAEEKTIFARKDSAYDIACLDTDTDSLGVSPYIGWYVDDEPVGMDSYLGWSLNPGSSSLHKKNAEVDDASRDIQCAVISKTAFDIYGSVDTAMKNGAAAKIKKTLSVINVTGCKKLPCQLEVSVHGATPVNITWMIGNEIVASNLSVKEENVTRSRTDTLNSTKEVLLKITGGQNTLSENVTLGDNSNGDHDKGPETWVIVLAVVGSIAIIGAICFALYWFCYRRKPKGPEDPLGNGTGEQADQTVDATEMDPLKKKQAMPDDSINLESTDLGKPGGNGEGKQAEGNGEKAGLLKEETGPDDS